MKQTSKYKLCRNDIILAAVFAAAAVILAVIFFLVPGKRQGNTLVITIDGQEYGRYSLSKEQTINIETERGINTVVIKDNAAHMEEADCPDSYCIKMGKKSNAGETIVCLPHRLVVEIVSEDNAPLEFDVIAE